MANEIQFKADPAGSLQGPDGRFLKGVSGNPNGRPPGPSKQRKLITRMLDEADDVLDAVLKKAKEGEPASAALILGRILPVLRTQSQTVTFDLDPTLPITRQVEQVLAAVASGDLAPDLGQQIISSAGTLANMRATEELAARLTVLEAKHFKK